MKHYLSKFLATFEVKGSLTLMFWFIVFLAASAATGYLAFIGTGIISVKVAQTAFYICLSLTVVFLIIPLTAREARDDNQTQLGGKS